MSRTKVLLVSAVDFSDPNGGGVWASTLLENIARVSGVDCVVASIGQQSTSNANHKLITGLGLGHVFVPVTERPRPQVSGVGALTLSALNLLADKYYFEWERKSRRQDHIDAAVMRIVANEKPDVVLIGYLYTALFAPSLFSSRTPVCMLTLNKEAEFHRSHRALGGPAGRSLIDVVARWIYRHGNWLANVRVARYEKRIYSSCAGVATLTHNDLPGDLPPRVVTEVLPPLPRASALRWAYRGGRRVFFVGNIAHYPNRLAIEWICEKFAESLFDCDPTIRINIIGATQDQVLRGRGARNVDFMGLSDRAQVVEQMTTAELFIAPIANNFGAKIKLAECAAYGMPFVATETAMSGLKFLQGIPRISLEHPVDAAKLVAWHVNAREVLEDLSESIDRQLQQARANQAMAWSSFIGRSLERQRLQESGSPRS